MIILLMLVGGSPGSTAGGIKTTTVAVLFATALSTFRRKEYTHFFGRRIDNSVIKKRGNYSVDVPCTAFLWRAGD